MDPTARIQYPFQLLNKRFGRQGFDAFNQAAGGLVPVSSKLALPRYGDWGDPSLLGGREFSEFHSSLTINLDSCQEHPSWPTAGPQQNTNLYRSAR